jgi:hypothetical protein
VRSAPDLRSEFFRPVSGNKKASEFKTNSGAFCFWPLTKNDSKQQGQAAHKAASGAATTPGGRPEQNRVKNL